MKSIRQEFEIVSVGNKVLVKLELKPSRPNIMGNYAR